ncbi:MAG: hypothetical protein ACI9FB_002456 [Candidatus Azotimanducaceae bacterium]|jgi:hypothetical protein
MDKRRACILGAFSADAATMGFHWLYSQEKILSLAATKPEFYSPKVEDYKGVGYFAHPDKIVGDLSHYGEQAWVMLSGLAKNNNQYDKQVYQDTFRDHFGYGGKFVGYIDRPTRQTLDEIYHSESESLKATNNIPFDGENRKVLLTKVLAAAKLHHGNELLNAVESIAAREPNSVESKKYVTALVDAMAGGEAYLGADDDQLPAISQLPVLVASHSEPKNLFTDSESSIRVTNNNARAIDFGQVATRLLDSLIQGISIDDAIESAVGRGNEKTQLLLRNGLNCDKDVLGVTKEFGMNCDVGSGMVSTLCNLRSAVSFEDAIRRNIYAGGDNCGRSILLGAAAGIIFGIGGDKGVPTDWVGKISQSTNIQKMVDQVLNIE